MSIAPYPRMPRHRFVLLFPLVALLLAGGAVAQALATPKAVASRHVQHERQVVDELLQLVAMPNVARGDDDLAEIVRQMTAMFGRRGFRVETESGRGAPVIRATLEVPGTRGTLAFFISTYDGQPADARGWTRCPPFAPCLYDGAAPVTLSADTKLDPEWRVYGRSGFYDKAPIAAILDAVDALHATGAGLTLTLFTARNDLHSGNYGN